MVSLWGTKNGNKSQDGENERNGENQESHGTEHRHREPDERTRLINTPPNNDGYLDLDDPAVSPYNLWSVRALRYLAVLFFIITFLWWVLLLVSIFVSPPGMHSRGSGFFDFSYTTVTLGNLLVAILFFVVPSKSLEITSAIIAVLLLADMIVIVSVPLLRFEEGWVGITSVVWATLIALFNVMTDRVVAWGKREEEERLTGRRETRRSLKEWIAIFAYTVVMIGIIVVVVLITATLVLRARDASLQAPGTRWYVDSNKYQVHVDCVGNISYSPTGEPYPTVLIEAGEDPFKGTMEPFIRDAYKNGTIPRYCYWDRPGISFSDNAPSPHSAGMSADALSEALAFAGEEGPWVLLSAGIGSIYSRIFSSRHVGDIKALMLIDPLHEDLLWQISTPGQGFLLWAWGIISPLGLDRLPAALFKGRTREDRVWGPSAYQSGKFIKAKLQESLVANSLTKSEVSAARTIQSREVPLVIVSSGIHVRRNENWRRKQEDLTRLTDKLVAWDTVRKAPSDVWETFEGRKTLEKRLGELVAL